MFTINNVCNPYGIHYIPELKEAKVNYVIYSVNKGGLTPFVSFYLVNNNNILSFPYTLGYHYVDNKSDGIEDIYTLMASYSYDIQSIQPMGYVVDYLYGSFGNTNIYIFYELVINNTESFEVARNQLIWPVAFWEIFTTGKVVDKIVEVTVIRALHKHITILPLTDSPETDDIKYSDPQYPMVGYSLHTRKMVNFNAVFGASRNPNGELGDYFYYYKTLDDILPELNTNESYGIVRYIITNNTNNCTSVFNEFVHSSDENTICITDKYIITHNMSVAHPHTYHLI
jgi:hypothetical protein